MLKKNSHGITKTEWLVAIGILLVLFLVLDDTLNNGKYAVRTRGCQSNLGKIGQAVLSFRAVHGGRMPPNLAALSYKHIMICWVWSLSPVQCRNCGLPKYTLNAPGNPKLTDFDPED